MILSYTFLGSLGLGVLAAVLYCCAATVRWGFGEQVSSPAVFGLVIWFVLFVVSVVYAADVVCAHLGNSSREGRATRPKEF